MEMVEVRIRSHSWLISISVRLAGFGRENRLTPAANMRMNVYFHANPAFYVHQKQTIVFTAPLKNFRSGQS
jgi:hypothetical protein